MKENKKLTLFEGLAFLCACLAIIGCIFTAYAEGSDVKLTMFELIFGNERTDTNGWLIFAFVLLILSAIISLTCSLLCFFNKTKNYLNTILGISGGVTALTGGIVLACAVMVTGLDKQNSELGLIQGNWSLGLADYLIPLSSLASLILSYPAAMSLAHQADLKDMAKEKKINSGSKKM